MALLQGAIFLFFGVGLLIIDYRALRSGTIPVWGFGFGGRARVARDTRPLGFWLSFALYGAGGLALTIFGARVLAGLSSPLPLA
ncbi:MAG: hypothetical protein ACREBN_03135 [Burkholderiaceae bacterium]